jgi:hypothetical protein
MTEPIGITVLQDQSNPPGYVVIRVTGVARAPLDESFTIRRADSETSSIGSDWPVGSRHPVSSDWHEDGLVLDLVVGPDTVNPIPGGTPVVIRLPGVTDQDIALNWPDGLLLAAKENRRRGRPRNEIVAPNSEFGEDAFVRRDRVSPPPPDAMQEQLARQQESRRLEEEAARQHQKMLEANQREALRLRREAESKTEAEAEAKAKREAEQQLHLDEQKKAEADRLEALNRQARLEAQKAQAIAAAPEPAPISTTAAQARSSRLPYIVLIGLVVAGLLVIAILFATKSPAPRKELPASSAPPASAVPDSTCSPAHASAGLCVIRQ